MICLTLYTLLTQVKGSDVLLHDGKPVGYASSPIETVRKYVFIAFYDWTTSVQWELYLLPRVCKTTQSLSQPFQTFSPVSSTWKDIPKQCNSFYYMQVNYVSAHDNETLFDIISLKVNSLLQYATFSFLITEISLKTICNLYMHCFCSCIISRFTSIDSKGHFCGGEMQDEPLSDQRNSPFSGQIQFVPWKN